MRIAVALLNFGGPQSREELEPFLSELLADVLPGPSWLKRWIAPLIANRRAHAVAGNYQMIGWSPLVPTHHRQADALRALLPDDQVIVSGMMFTAPTMTQAAQALARENIDGIIALPFFPHYSLATTQAAFTFFHQALVKQGLGALPVHWVGAWYEHPDYIEALAQTIREGVERTPGKGPCHLLFSPHGLPISFVRRGDPYPDHVRASIRSVLAHLDWQGPSHIGWQSRVGPAKWLSPSTPEVMDRLGAEGVERVCLVPISFVSEHVETLHEIDIEYREHAEAAGIKHFGRAPALELQPAFIRTLASLVQTASAEFQRAHCMRCLQLRTKVNPVRPSCPNCNWQAPSFLVSPGD